MKVNVMPKPVDFKLGEYINKGFELLKKDFGNIFVAFLVCCIMSIIPFCAVLAMGNLYKYLQRIHRNQPASPGIFLILKILCRILYCSLLSLEE